MEIKDQPLLIISFEFKNLFIFFCLVMNSLIAISYDAFYVMFRFVADKKTHLLAHLKVA